jgi:hypothetical protein
MGQLLEWFRDPWFAALFSLALSLVAVILAACAWRANRRNAEQLLELERAWQRDRLSGGNRAALVAKLTAEDRGRHKAFFLVIENRGEATARRVQGRLDGIPFPEHRAWWEKLPDDLCIRPSSDVRFVRAINDGCAPPFDLDLTWQEDSGEAGSYRTTLTMQLPQGD